MADHIKQVSPLDVVHRHIGRIVFFEDPVNADNLWMPELRETVCLLDETPNELLTTLPAVGRAHADPGPPTAAEGGREAFLDHNVAVQTVLGQVGDPEAAAVDVARDSILAVEEDRTRWQTVADLIIAVGKRKLCHRHGPYRPFADAAPGSRAQRLK